MKENTKLARVVELVDTRDLKSLDSDIVPVQVRPRVPNLKVFKPICKTCFQIHLNSYFEK